MSASHHHVTRWDGWLPPLIGLAAAVAVGFKAGGWLALPVFLLLLVSVRAAVHHAEVVAARVGEPFGALILALAVTVIEVALIASVMLTSDPPNTTLLRDTIHAVVMLVAAGLTGLCIVIAALRHREPGFSAEGAAALLSVVGAMATLVLILPNYVLAIPGPEYNVAQMAVVAGLCLSLWIVFTWTQTVRYRAYFIPGTTPAEADQGPPPTAREAGIAALLLLLALTAVVLLAKTVAPAIGETVAALRLPAGVTGVVVAAIVLMPEAATALRAAREDRLQTSLNLALGSAIATIGLSVPILVALAIWLGQPLQLGVSQADTVLLALTFLTGMLALSGRITNLLQGCVLLVVFGAWLLVVFVP